ncbi:MAG TPA: response regulator [bacterium]|nr:response regulator [bacterium]
MGASASESPFVYAGNKPQSDDMHVQKVHGALSTDSRTPRILIVDEEEGTVGFFERIVGQLTPAEFRSTTDPGAIVDLLLRFLPDLIVLDLCMPNTDGLALLHVVTARIPVGVYLPIVALTSETSAESKDRIVANGATDVLTKPFDPAEVQIRIAHLLRRRALYLEGRTRSSEPGHGYWAVAAVKPSSALHSPRISARPYR